MNRVTMQAWELGWIDLDLRVPLDCGPILLATYCPIRMRKHAKSESTQPSRESSWLPRMFTYNCDAWQDREDLLSNLFKIWFLFHTVQSMGPITQGLHDWIVFLVIDAPVVDGNVRLPLDQRQHVRVDVVLLRRQTRDHVVLESEPVLGFSSVANVITTRFSDMA